VVDALVAGMLKNTVLHADETPAAMLKPSHCMDLELDLTLLRGRWDLILTSE
jgi:hypothetical protein